MPPVPPEEETTFTVLLTGFGPFREFSENPSWLAVKPLQNTVIELEEPAEPIVVEGQLATKEDVEDVPWQRIHISVLEIPVVYEAVLEIVPGLHQRPPVLPENAEGIPGVPNKGYDLIFHVGVAGRGPLRVERVGHKLGYQMKDAAGQLAPIVESIVPDFDRNRDGYPLGTVNMEMLAMESDSLQADVPRLNRGFGIGYEKFPEELFTDIDVAGAVQSLKRDGIDQIYTSMDAGHFLCDFIYYCSLAESRRSAYEKGRAFAFEKGGTQVLFMHCPPVNQPLSTAEVTEAIRRIIELLAKQ